MPAVSIDLLCSRCNTPLPAEGFNTGEPVVCSGCQAQTLVTVFPAVLRGIASGKPAESLLVDTDASCFYHPQKKAEISCGNCGRFLCSLCDVDLNGEHLCPPCIEAGRQKGKLERLENRRVLYDEIAVSLALYPILIFIVFYVSILTAPIALYISIRYWNAPSSIVARSKIRFVVAIVIASLQLLAWGTVSYFLIRKL